ncbi:MAG TPA: hypothetical protein VK436_12380 [Methanocella sp.]|nr:hypothetical protein [Methanocella sp.]
MGDGELGVRELGVTSLLRPLVIIVVMTILICSTQAAWIARAQEYGSSPQGYDQVGYSSQASSDSNSPEGIMIQGFEGLAGFMPGQNRLSLAVMPVSTENGQMMFQLIGFAISSPNMDQSAVYSLSTALPGVIDTSQSTMQVDLSDLDSAINQAGYINSDQVYDSIRTDSRITVIDIDMIYNGAQNDRTTFIVNAVDIVPPDGIMEAYSMQKPTQLIIDAQTSRIYMVAFPQMIDTFSTMYGSTYPEVSPVVYSEPVPVMAPVFIPYIEPVPIYTSNFIPYSPFYFGSGFYPFWDRSLYHGYGYGGFPIHQPFLHQGWYHNFWNRFSWGKPGWGRPGWGKPGWGRPGWGGGNRPGIGEGNRPGWGGGNRPGTKPATKPGFGRGNLPGGAKGNKPVTGVQPNIGRGNRPSFGQGNRPGFGQGNKPVTGVQPNIGRGNRPSFGQGAKPVTGGKQWSGAGGISPGNINRGGPGGQFNKPSGTGIRSPARAPSGGSKSFGAGGGSRVSGGKGAGRRR